METVKDRILNCLIDDGESIIQIMGCFSRLNIEISRDLVISEIKDLLACELIEIAYPQDGSVITKENIEDYWFELTEKGKEAWKQTGEELERQSNGRN